MNVASFQAEQLGITEIVAIAGLDQAGRRMHSSQPCRLPPAPPIALSIFPLSSTTHSSNSKKAFDVLNQRAQGRIVVVATSSWLRRDKLSNVLILSLSIKTITGIFTQTDLCQFRVHYDFTYFQLPTTIAKSHIIQRIYYCAQKAV